MGLSVWHVVALGAVVFLLFGKGKFSGLMEDIAKGIKSLKHGIAEEGEASQLPPPVREVHHYHGAKEGDEAK